MLAADIRKKSSPQGSIRSKTGLYLTKAT